MVKRSWTKNKDVQASTTDNDIAKEKKGGWGGRDAGLIAAAARNSVVGILVTGILNRNSLPRTQIENSRYTSSKDAIITMTTSLINQNSSPKIEATAHMHHYAWTANEACARLIGVPRHAERKMAPSGTSTSFSTR
ncbi:hypothetical protein CEXT_222901 [Caerostris extrusa]|uniref:Uncharacterized protein n=1 Tax=Caerostris extrusa TaxID=172846 RepID=A0AAV4NP85_CAEEX|nr:hypothetical protein CEXT_222901 [Caerostris extrusa]